MNFYDKNPEFFQLMQLIVGISLGIIFVLMLDTHIRNLINTEQTKFKIGMLEELETTMVSFFRRKI